MRIERGFFAALAASILFCAPLGAAESGILRVGASKVDLSPTSDMFPMKGMQNYIGVHDPIFARALVVDNGSGKAALITLDATGVPGGDDLVKALTAELGIAPDHLLLTATHDHNAPQAGPGWNGVSSPAAEGYYALLKKGVLEAARQANAHLEPARIGFGTGKAYVNVNRDEKIGAGYHMGYAPDLPSDKTVAVVSFTNLAGEPIAVYANYAVHGVVMFRVKSRDGQVEVTGDLPGATSQYVEDHFKKAVALWTSGAAGDQNPVFMANYNQDAPDVHDEGPAGWAILDVEARRLGEEIVRVTKAVANTTDRVTIWGEQRSVTCPGQKRAEAPKPGSVMGGYLAPPNVKMVDGDPVLIPLTLVMINDIALAGVSGEVFTEIGEHLKRDSLFDRTVMVTLAPNGIGYIPTDAGFLLPSEKAVGNRLKPGCAEPAIIQGFQGMMREYLGTPGTVTASQ